MTPELDRYFLGGGPVHINADFPEKRDRREWTQLGSRPAVRAIQFSAHGGLSAALAARGDRGDYKTK